MNVRELIINNTPIQGLELPLQHAVLIVAVAPKGYLMCGYLDVAVAEQKQDCAAVIRGVSRFEELLEGRVAACTSAAHQAGITVGMTGYEALVRMI
jgi:uncharacterized protein YunC (DUF1805 family)